MLFNKSSYVKANDKKVLHKVGKQWKVISVALLMAIGGGAAVAASNNNANADATDNAYNDAAGVTNDTAAQAEALENNDFNGNFDQSSAAPKSASKSTAKPSLANINYAPSERYAGNNASAASYRNNQSFDNANINYYGPIVKGYVDEINAKFPEARSLQASYSDLQGKTNNARSAANSYSATAQNPRTASTISVKASAAHQTTSDYTDSVAYHVLDSVNGFMPRVSNAAKGASEDSVVASYANLISNINANPALAAEYSAKKAEADANYDVAKNYQKNANEAVTTIANDSAANDNKLTQNTIYSIDASGKESVAEENSTEDANFVNSIASSAGFKYNSSVVSSAISLMASRANSMDPHADISSVAPYAATDFSDNGQTVANAGSLVFSANNSSISTSVLDDSNYTEFSEAAKAAADAGNVAQENSYDAGMDLIRDVSDTATQESYDSYASGLSKDIKAEKAAKTSYSNAVSGANENLVKANNSLSAASSARKVDDFLGHNPRIYNLFGTPKQENFYNADALDGTSYGHALQDALAEAGANNNTNEHDLASKVANVQSALINDLSHVGNYVDQGNGKFDDSKLASLPAIKGALEGAGFGANNTTDANHLAPILMHLQRDVNAITTADLYTGSAPSYDNSDFTLYAKALDLDKTNDSAKLTAIKNLVNDASNVGGFNLTTTPNNKVANINTNIHIVNDALSKLGGNTLNKSGKFDLDDLNASNPESTYNPTEFASGGKYSSLDSDIKGLFNAYGINNNDSFNMIKLDNAMVPFTELQGADLVSGGTADTGSTLNTDINNAVNAVDSSNTDETSTVRSLVENSPYGADKLSSLQSNVNGLSVAGLLSGTHNYDESKVNGVPYADIIKELFNDAGIQNGTSNLEDIESKVPAMEGAIDGLDANHMVSLHAGNVYVGGLLDASDYASAVGDRNITGPAVGINATGTTSASANSSAVSELDSTANSAGSAYNSVSSASASYAKATDQDVTIASQFNSYYNSIANSDATLASNAKASLDNYRATHASNPTDYMNVSSAYASASAAEPNDKDFAYAYGKNVFLNTPEYVTVKKNAVLHSGTQYAKANSVESVKAGTQLIVNGVGFDKQGNVRYVVADHKGKNLYLTANDAYVKNTYLAPSVNYTVKLDKDAVAHSTLGFHKDTKGTIPAGTQVDGYTVPTSTNSGRRDAAYGVTRLQINGGKFNGDYITTNVKFLNVVSVNGGNEQAANQQNTNPAQHTINFAD